MRVSCFYIIFAACSIQLLLANSGKGQTLSGLKVKLDVQNETLESVLKRIEKQTGLTFAYLPEDVAHCDSITLEVGTVSVEYVLGSALKNTRLTYRQLDKTVILFPSRNEGIKSESAKDRVNEVSLPVTVTGKISELDGSPLAGANIIEKGTSNGTASDVDGRYTISVAEDATLVFSFIGRKSVEVKVSGQTVIDIMLEEDIAALQEVVVNAGYWQVKQKEQTGNIVKIGAEDIEKQPVSNPLQALQGRMTGVYIQQTVGTPGGAMNIQIRGQNSFRTFLNNSGIDGNAPLYVIDGVPFSFQSLSEPRTNNGIFDGQGTNPLNGINATDIESIEVLKDADATSIYGSRGANGVVLITTKKGKTGKTKVDVNVYSGVTKVGRKVELLNTQQYLQMREEAYANDGISSYPVNAYDINGSWDRNKYTDWQKLLIGNSAPLTNAQISISGGSEKTTVFFSGSYRKEAAVFAGDFGYLKGSGHLSANHTSSNNKLTAHLTVSYSADENYQPGTDLLLIASKLAPNAPALYNEDGTLNWQNSTWTNPIAQTRQTFEGRTNTLISNGVLTYEIFDGLQLKTNLGFNRMESKESFKTPSTYYDPALGRTSADASNTFSNGAFKTWLVEPQINYEKSIGSGRFGVLVGSTFQNQDRNRSRFSARGFPSDALIDNGRIATSFTWQDYNNSVYKYHAIFGRINYNWSGKYIINLTGRRDGSSRFGPGRKFANFGAVGLAWIFSEEDFLKKNSAVVSFGKLRLSYGATGNDQIGDYTYLDTYSTGTSYQGVGGLAPTRLFNPDFAWEVNKKAEVGLDLGFFEDRISIKASYYQNRSTNQLVNSPLPAMTGFNDIQENLNATIRNTGLEIELTTININKGALHWSTSVNITAPRNKLIEFPGLASSSYANRYVIGQPLNIQKLLHFTGINPETGVAEFADSNGDGAITAADQVFVKRIGQDYYGGLNNSLTYKGFQLDLFVQFVRQSGYNELYGLDLPGSAVNQPAYLFDLPRWQKPGDIATFPRFTASTDFQPLLDFYNYTYFSDLIIDNDASFIRFKNVAISYTFPNRFTNGHRCRIYFQGQNLFTVTKYKGLDPETQRPDRIAPLKIFTAGLQITLNP